MCEELGGGNLRVLAGPAVRWVEAEAEEEGPEAVLGGEEAPGPVSWGPASRGLRIRGGWTRSRWNWPRGRWIRQFVAGLEQKIQSFGGEECG